LYKRLNYNFIVINKLTVEVIKAKKGLDTLYYIKGLLIINGLNFLGLILILSILTINLNILYILPQIRFF